MRPLALSLLAGALFLTGAAPGGSPLPAALERALDAKDPIALADTTLPRLARLDSTQRAAVARRIASWPVPRRVAAWAFLQVGTPYQLGPLGEEAPPDTQPLIEFATSDCAVLNLVSAALAHAAEAGGERAAMAIANYRGGVVSYATRFHFTTDRHESLLWRGRTLLHASSTTGRVVTIPWNEYLAGPGRRHDGFVLFEYR